MSDAPFPPVTGDESDDPRKRTGLLRLSDAGIIATSRLDGFGEDPLSEAPATASSGTRDDQGPRDAPSSPLSVPSTDDAAGPMPLANEAADDDGQPRLDLRFPDDAPVPWLSPLPEPPQLGEAVVSPPAVIEQPPHPYENAGFNALDAPEVGPPPPPFLSGPLQLREASEAEQAPFPAELPAAVSPILSALDAAERQTEQTGSITDAGYPFGSRMFMPHPPIPNFGLRKPPADAGEEEGQDAAAWPAPDARPPAAIDAAPPRPPEAAAPGAAQAWSPQDGIPLPAGPFLDATAKIAAEASATAEALENLKRLLQHKLPILDNLPPPAPTVRAPERVALPPRAFAHPVQATAGLPPVITRAVSLPPLPMPLAVERGGTGVYMRGFLAGLGLSLVAGMVLYLFMAIG